MLTMVFVPSPVPLGKNLIFRQDLMAFSSEVIDEIKRCNVPWVEVPVTVRYTESSLKGSKQGKWPAAKIVRDLFLGEIC